MLRDMLTIAGKDLKEMLVQRGSIRAGIGNILIVVFISGVIFPLQMGREWITSPIGLATVSWLPLFMSMGLVADAFAGERERHTLETLLSSRISDRAILYGKMLASVTYGLAIAVLGMLLGALVVNIQFPGLGFYPLPNLIGALVFSLLGMLLVTGIGVQVSLYASSVRQAYQKMSMGFLVLWLPLIVGPQIMPQSWKLAIEAWVRNIDGAQVLGLIGAALLAADLALIMLARARFRRSRLILD